MFLSKLTRGIDIVLHVHGAQLLLRREAVHLAVGDGTHESGLHAGQPTAGEEMGGGWEAGGRDQGAQNEQVAAAHPAVRRAPRTAAGSRRLAGRLGQTLHTAHLARAVGAAQAVAASALQAQRGVVEQDAAAIAQRELAVAQLLLLVIVLLVLQGQRIGRYRGCVYVVLKNNARETAAVAQLAIRLILNKFTASQAQQAPDQARLTTGGSPMWRSAQRCSACAVTTAGFLSPPNRPTR